MDLLLVLGLLLVASALTLLNTSARGWVMCFAQGLGIQAFLAAGVSAVQIAALLPTTDQFSIPQRAQMVIKGIPLHVGGWSALQTSSAIVGPDTPSIGLDIYLPLMAVQALGFAALYAWRLHRSDAIGDPLLIVLGGASLANAIGSMTWHWWT